MIKIENTEVFGWEAAIRGMRNPKNSWERSDSVVCMNAVSIGDNDMHLMNVLANAGTDHGKFLRMITVYVDLTAPLYWWKEFDTYKVGTVANSCSTMHKIDSRDLTMDDFSVEHLTKLGRRCIQQCIVAMNDARSQFKESHDKNDWWQMIQLLPSSYNQKRTVMLNYAVLKNMYKSRKNHKLDEWHDLCHWIESLTCSELITGKVDVHD